MQELPRMVPPPEVPRAFNSSFDGCPVHGTELFKFGNYSWIIDPFENPWKITCPVGGEEYPSNDFKAYLDSGMEDRSSLTGEYPDDGWGWLREGEVKKHWFIAYYCHWYWYNHLLPAVLALSRAYLLTGREEYGSSCLVLLDRIAEYYPRMNYNAQSRYAEEFRSEYDGKIVNLIWETNVIRHLAEAVSNIRPFIHRETSDLVDKSTAQLLGHLEENILLEGLRGIGENKIRGNYGMHQRSALVILKALDRDEVTREWLEMLLDNPGGGYPLQGIRYAMDNFIYREGVAYENAPGYCITWTRNLLEIAFHLKTLGVDDLDWEKLRRMVEAPGRMVCQGHTPAIGDSGGVGSGRVELPPRHTALAYRLMPSPAFAGALEPCITCYEDLFLPPIGQGENRRGNTVPGRESDCLGGYGLVLLRKGELACSMYFGRKNGHGHFDRLGIELFGFGKKLTPDLGYPQFASESKNPPSWERNTISHNTVTVNERKQDTGSAGELVMFHTGPVEVAEASARRTYRAADIYSRTLGIVGSVNPFFFDIFRVSGGCAHDYSIHGNSDALSLDGIVMSERGGTLAGEGVPYGYLYDDPDLEDPEKERSFYSYCGSGFSYLYDLMAGKPGGTFSAEWRHEGASLRLFFPHTCQGVISASGNPPLRPGNPESLRYLILRNRGNDLSSAFTFVGDAYREDGSVESVKSLPVVCEDEGAMPVGISVKTGGVEHIVLSSLSPRSRLRAPELEFSGRLLILARRKEELIEFFMDGSYMEFGDWVLSAGEGIRGRVGSVDPGNKRIRMEMGEWVMPDLLVGHRAFFDNSRRSSSFLIVGADYADGALELELDGDGRMGHLKIDGFEGRDALTGTELLLAGHGYYEGAYLVDAGFEKWLEIEVVQGGRIRLVDEPRDQDLTDAYVWEFGPGDRVSVGNAIHISRRRKAWSGWSNVPAEVRRGGRARCVGPGRFYIRDR